MLLHNLFACSVSNKKSDVILASVSVVSFLTLFMIVSLSLALRYFIICDMTLFYVST